MKNIELSITEMRLKSRKVLIQIIQKYDKSTIPPEQLSDREIQAFQDSWKIANMEQHAATLVGLVSEQWSGLNFLIERFNAIYNEQFLPEFSPVASSTLVDGGLGQISAQVLKTFEQIQQLFTDFVTLQQSVSAICDSQGLVAALKQSKSEMFSDKVILQMTQDVNTLEQALKRRAAQKKLSRSNPM